MEERIFLGDPPNAQLPSWKEFRVGLKDLLEGLVPKKLWWHSTPGWWYTSSGLERMRKFLTKRLDMVEKLGRRPVGLLLSTITITITRFITREGHTPSLPVRLKP
jgi:hypothetical protein